MIPAKAASKWAVVLVVALGTAACESSSQQTPSAPAAAAEPAPAAEVAKPSGVVGEHLVQGTAKVVAVHKENRHVLLQRDDGVKIAVVCGDEVRNFDQIAVGDTVTVGYYESLAYEVHKAGEASPGAEAAGVAGRAKAGEKPGAGAATAVKVTATIVAIDTPNMRVSLKGPDGDVVTVRVRDAEKLSRCVVGDTIDIVYTEAMAVSVSKQ